jgi:hypothetical protein
VDRLHLRRGSDGADGRRSRETKTKAGPRAGLDILVPSNVKAGAGKADNLRKHSINVERERLDMSSSLVGTDLQRVGVAATISQL